MNIYSNRCEGLVQFQRIDPVTGLVYPWFTHPFLDDLDTWDLKDKIWLEFGAGRGTPWLRKRCKFVYTIETNLEWVVRVADECASYGLDNGRILYDELSDGIEDHLERYFALIPPLQDYDIISVDGLYRTDCIKWAIEHFKGKRGILIADNWQQDYVWISPGAEDMVKSFFPHIYQQPDHTVHEGRPWQTAWWTIAGPWDITHPYDSHRPVLKKCLDWLFEHDTLREFKPYPFALELGCGYGSTYSLADNKNIVFRSFETNPEWAEKFGTITQVTDDYHAIADQLAGVDLVFIDCAPGEIRKELIKQWADKATLIVAHDTEPGADYVYNMAGVLSEFKYRKDYHPSPSPSTTVVSNYIDVSNWEI